MNDMDIFSSRRGLRTRPDHRVGLPRSLRALVLPACGGGGWPTASNTPSSMKLSGRILAGRYLGAHPNAPNVSEKQRPPTSISSGRGLVAARP